MGWTADPRSGLDPAHYLSAPLVASLDGIGWDVYADSDATRDPAEMYGRCRAISAAHQLPWGVFETGARVVPGTVDRAHADWYAEAIGWCRANGAAFYTLWNSSTGGNDYRLDRLPATQAVWQAAARWTDPTAALRRQVDTLTTQLATAGTETDRLRADVQRRTATMTAIRDLLTG